MSATIKAFATGHSSSSKRLRSRDPVVRRDMGPEYHAGTVRWPLLDDVAPRANIHLDRM
jgi:hypothetical protein